MRFFTILFFSCCTLLATAQEKSVIANSLKGTSLLNRISVTATVGTPTFSTSDLSTITTQRLSEVNLGQLTISYKVNPRLSFGLSTMGSLSSNKAGYFDAENQFFSLCDDDDHDDDDDDHDDYDDDHDDDDDDDYDDDDDDYDDDDDDDDDDCDEDDLGQNLMGIATFKLSEKLPFFVQAGAGYTFAGNAPTYTAMIGYNQKIVAGIGIMAGIRYSDVLYKSPIDAIRTVSGDGLKAELGLSWNF